MKIPFNRPCLTGREQEYVREALSRGPLASNGPFTHRASAWLERRLGCRRALLTHSATAALEMAALLIDVQPGDEVILPSFTFTSTANAFVLRGAIPVFVDVRPDTLNLDETRLEAAITPRTRAIVPVHYAGVPCNMEKILDVAERHNLVVIEDAAQAILSTYRGRAAGSLGHLAALSFHETKNVTAGEGGALLINDKRFIDRAHVLLEKGTNRREFFLGHVDKYTWLDLGSSFGPGELVAAFLLAQLEAADEINMARIKVWNHYLRAFSPLISEGLLQGPAIPNDCHHNGHLFYVLAPRPEDQQALIQSLNQAGIGAVFHYLPLHLSPAGRRFGRPHGPMHVTESAAYRLVRLPVWAGLPDEAVEEAAAVTARAASRWCDSPWDAPAGPPSEPLPKSRRTAAA
jgi:dTDP-4-amino-4,6-dideoxygalactose transaminase